MSLVVGTPYELNVDASTVCAFYSDNWKRRIALMDETFYTWQFKMAPNSNGNDHCVIAVDSETGEIAGVMGLNPRTFMLGNQDFKGAELTTWVVSEKYRSVGAGAKILNHILDKYEVLIGMGISAMALPVYVRSGFRYLSAIPRFVRVYNFDSVEKISKMDRIARKAAGIWRTNCQNREYSEVEFNSDKADKIISNFYNSHNMFSRDEGHLNWRYSSHPYFRYEIYTIRDAETWDEALVVLRRESAIDNFLLCHVMDIIGSDDAINAAFSFIDDFCEGIGADAADFYCTSSSINKHPLGRGWFSTTDDRFFEFPHLFHPLEIRSPATTSLIYWSKNELTQMCDFSKLYITKQDADFDRPTLKD
ncbi:hypothetical protein BK655_12175 [Pseudomonas brassicacearum]|uniref:GNAT family N-acetyltransferase n=1 Tax=Pseudomonas brassicacearum TaxID=930166 RepID=UPI000F46BC58|nr:GNAT family N-acetyltransferase [Pseudomonas brassicacearum]ROM84103.1 hypothetical protein BK655_12175 [Pseudomonas brassicacearum]